MAVVGEDGTVYATTYDGYLVALASEGTPRWHRQFPRTFWVPPALGSDCTIYVSAQRPPFSDIPDALTALNADGSMRWEIASPDATPIIAADGTILMANSGGQLVGFNPDGTVGWWTATWNQYSPGALDDSGVLYVGSANSLFAHGPKGGQIASATNGHINRVKPIKD